VNSEMLREACHGGITGRIVERHSGVTVSGGAAGVSARRQDGHFCGTCIRQQAPTPWPLPQRLGEGERVPEGLVGSSRSALDDRCVVCDDEGNAGVGSREAEGETLEIRSWRRD
jgi:hypothetical protein